jgi:hypothetical protein
MRRLALLALALASAGCGGGAAVSSGPPAEPASVAEPASTAAAGAAAAGAAAAGPAFAGPASAGPASAETLPRPNRPLTAGERTLLRPLFRDGIDYDRVRVIGAPFPFQPADTYLTMGGHIYAPGPLFRADFSRQADDRAVLVHEIGHVWQFTNGVDLIAHGLAELVKHRGDYQQAYWYRLEPGRDLTDYGVEQQASILEDYFLITVARDHASRMVNRGLSTRARDRLFAGVLRRFLENPRYARGSAAGARPVH